MTGSPMNGLLHHGDCLHIMPSLPPQSVDLVLADLPYGTTSCAWDSLLPLDQLWREYKRLVKPNGAILLFGIMPFSALLWQSNPADWRYEFVWRKNGTTRFLDSNERPLLDYENIEVFYAQQPTYNPQKFRGQKVHSRGRSIGRKRNGIYGDYFATKSDESGEKFPRLVLDFDKVPPSEILHPTQKPVALCEYLIRTYTNPGDIVLDNTMGVGSIGVACKQTGRGFVGIEKLPEKPEDPDYFGIAEKRIMDTHPPLSPLFMDDPVRGMTARQNELF